MSLLFSTGLMKWRLCIAIAEPQQSYPAAKKPETDADTARDTAFGPSRPEIPAKKQKQTQIRRSVRVDPRWPVHDPS